MRRFVTEIIIGIACAVIGGIVLSFFTNLTVLDRIGIACGILVLTGLVLGAFHLPGYIRRRYRAFKAGIVAAAKDQVLAVLVAEVPPQAKPTVDRAAVIRAIAVRARADQKRSLIALAERGRMLQGRVRYSNPTNTSIPSGLSSDVGDWEGQARSAIMDRPECLRDFEAATEVGPVPTVGRTVRRMEGQIAAIDRAVREFDEVPTS